MKLLNILPKEEKFYTLLKTLSQQAQNASHALHHWVQEGMKEASNHQPEEASAHYDKLYQGCFQQIHQAKQTAKATLRTVTEEACRTFITPFEREDIQELANALYRIPKLIEKTAVLLKTHNLRPKEGDLNRFTSLIVRQAEAFQELNHGLIGGLKPNLINEKAAILDEMEDQGDEAYTQLVAGLFANEPEIKTLLLRKEVYELLEDVTDYYRDAAGVALRIVLKHS